MDANTMLHERCVHIVDDEAEVRDALTLLLSTAQIESRSYGSAEEYLISNPLNEPACIPLDNHLPGKSGIDVTLRWSRSYPERRRAGQADSLAMRTRDPGRRAARARASSA